MSWEVCKENFQPLKQGRRVVPAETSEETCPDAAALEAQRRCGPLTAAAPTVSHRAVC